MKKPTPAELIATASRLLAAAERSLRKKPAHRPQPKPHRTAKDRPATPEEVAAAFANIRAMLAAK
jgi:membrane glycosyltransferase